MPAVNVNIQPEILTWVLSQIQENTLDRKWTDNITKWINGSKTPTFNQIEELSKKSRIPLGYFFLKTPPIEQIKLLEYRTVDSLKLANPSRDLIDTIHEMERIQDWMQGYKKEFGYDASQIVDSMKGCTDVKSITDRIRQDLELDIEWYEHCSDARTSFNYIRSKLEEIGVIVMMNGIVGSNTHRPLNIDEFRAFTINDSWVPLIFINAVDSQNGRLFSLLHEAAHIWLGEDSLFNDVYHSDNVSPLEIICNAVAAELLIPQKVFSRKWNEYISESDKMETITYLSKYFRCGEIVVARRALDNKKIGKDTYQHIVQRAIAFYDDARQNKKSPGGDFYNNMRSRLDSGFAKALCESVNTGRTSYTEAYRLSNTSHKTFSKIMQGLGGVVW